MSNQALQQFVYWWWWGAAPKLLSLLGVTEFWPALVCFPPGLVLFSPQTLCFWLAWILRPCAHHGLLRASKSTKDELDKSHLPGVCREDYFPAWYIKISPWDDIFDQNQSKKKKKKNCLVLLDSFAWSQKRLPLYFWFSPELCCRTFWMLWDCLITGWDNRSGLLRGLCPCERGLGNSEAPWRSSGRNRRLSQAGEWLPTVIFTLQFHNLQK